MGAQRKDSDRIYIHSCTRLSYSACIDNICTWPRNYRKYPGEINHKNHILTPQSQGKYRKQGLLSLTR